jgi:hypothetical protein
MRKEKGEKEKDKEQEMSDALEAFFGQFGKVDMYTSIVLEEFFKELMDGEK